MASTESTMICPPGFRAYLREHLKRAGKKRSARKTRACRKNGHAPVKPGSRPRGWQGYRSLTEENARRAAVGLPPIPGKAKTAPPPPTVTCRGCPHTWLLPAPVLERLDKGIGIVWTCPGCKIANRIHSGVKRAKPDAL